MTKYNPSKAELIEALVHIHYEIAQLLESLNNVNHKGIQNALIESRLLHVRVLIDFFEKKQRSSYQGKEKDDVLSVDYGFPAKKINISSQDKTRLNKKLAHLTYSRVNSTKEDSDWYFEKTIQPVLIRNIEFCKHMVSNFLPINSPLTVEHWQELVDKLEDIFNKKENIKNCSTGPANSAGL